MELGALICTPTSPSCLLCPVRDHCHAFHEGVQQELPVKTKKKNMRHVHLGAAVIETDEGDALIQKRPETGLLANLWEFPNVELSGAGNPKMELELFFRQEYGIDVELQAESIAKIQHVFSHLTWNIDVYYGKIKKSPVTKENSQWVKKGEVENFAFSVSHQKIWKKAQEEVK